MASAGITVDHLASALESQNRDISAGDFGEGKRRYVVRTVSRYESPRDVEETVITVRNGVPIYVKDVGDVALDYEKAQALVRQRGDAAVRHHAALREIGQEVSESGRHRSALRHHPREEAGREEPADRPGFPARCDRQGHGRGVFAPEYGEGPPRSVGIGAPGAGVRARQPGLLCRSQRIARESARGIRQDARGEIRVEEHADHDPL